MRNHIVLFAGFVTLVTAAACGGVAEDPDTQDGASGSGGSAAGGGDTGGSDSGGSDSGGSGQTAGTGASGPVPDGCEEVWESTRVRAKDSQGTLVECVANPHEASLDFVGSVEKVTVDAALVSLEINGCSPALNCFDMHYVQVSTLGGGLPPQGAFVRVRAVNEVNNGVDCAAHLLVTSVQTWDGFESPAPQPEGYVWIAAGDYSAATFDDAPFTVGLRSHDCPSSYMACGSAGFFAFEFAAPGVPDPIIVTMGRTDSLELASGQVVTVANRGSKYTGACHFERHVAYTVTALP